MLAGERQAEPLTGRITDAATGLPLAGVKVEIAGVVVFTDSRGRFEVPAAVPAPAADTVAADTVAVSFAGYQATRVAPRSLTELLEIPLTREARIEEVVVVSSHYTLKPADSGSVYTLGAADLEALPELGEDALRITNHLPGMATIGVSARPHIRGGLRDEALIIFNDVELLEPFHLRDFQSAFSGFNPSLVKTIDVYTGGYPARYGDRMSGVMDIEPADDITGFGAELAVSFLTTSAAAYGTTHGGQGEWALSWRRGNLDYVIDQVDSRAGDPVYSDWFGSFSWELTPGSELEFGALFYDDDIEFKDLDDGDGELAHSKYRNAYGWVQFHNSPGIRSTASTILSYGSIRHDRSGFINDEDLDEGSSQLDEEREFEVWRLGHQQFFEWSPELLFEFGARVNYQKGDYDIAAVILRGELAEFLGIEIEELRRVKTRPDGTSGGVYTSARWQPSDKLTLESGLRWDYQAYGGRCDAHWSPRLSALVAVSEDTEMRLSVGRFYQAEGIHELPAADGVEKFQGPQYADHYILGLSHQFGESAFSARIEAFYKRINDPKRRFENAFNSLVLMPEIASDRIEVAPSRARARGIETTLQYQPDENLNLWLSYSRSDTDDRLDGEWFPRSWDQTDTVSSGVVFQRDGWTFSGAVIWHSGWRTTRLPTRVAEDEQPELRRNDDRLPSYFSLDVKVSRTWEWPHQSLTLFAEATNVTDHENVGAYGYDIEEDEEDGGFFVSSEEEPLLPIVPSLGIRWRYF